MKNLIVCRKYSNCINKKTDFCFYDCPENVYKGSNRGKKRVPYELNPEDLQHAPTASKAEPDEEALENSANKAVYEKLGKEIGKLVDDKQKAYGDSANVGLDVLKAFMEKYKEENFYQGSKAVYVIPEALLSHLMYMVRIIDKQNRIFSNPEGDLMGESPYRDIAGYSLLGYDKIGGDDNE